MFKNAIIYRVRGLELESMRAQLSLKPLTMPGSQDTETRGWVPEQGEFVHAVGGVWLITMGVASRILPAAVVKAEVKARADQVRAAQGYLPGRRETRDIRDRVIFDLLPRAFIRTTHVRAWIDPQRELIAIDAPSTARAEDLLELLRRTLDSFQLKHWQCEHSAAGAMADWLASEPPADFTIDDDCELRAATSDGAVVRYVHHPLNADEVRAHMAAAKMPTKLGMTYADRLSFVFTERGEIKRLQLLDIVTEKLTEEAATASDAAALFNAAFALETAEIANLVQALTDARGGLLESRR